MIAKINMNAKQNKINFFYECTQKKWYIYEFSVNVC